MNEIKLDIFGEIAAAIRPQEITPEQESTFELLAKDYCEDPAGFINELSGMDEDTIAMALDQCYMRIDLARGLVKLFNECCIAERRVKAADKKFDEMRTLIYDFQTYNHK